MLEQDLLNRKGKAACRAYSPTDCQPPRISLPRSSLAHRFGFLLQMLMFSSVSVNTAGTGMSGLGGKGWFRQKSPAGAMARPAP
jgi:hypothetical protein